MNRHMEKFFHPDARVVGPSSQHRAAKALLLAVAMTLGTGCTTMLANRQPTAQAIARPGEFLVPREKALLDRIEANAKKAGYQVIYVDEGRRIDQVTMRLPGAMTPLKPAERDLFAQIQSRLGNLGVRILIAPTPAQMMRMRNMTVGQMVGSLIDQGVGFTQRAVTTASRTLMGMRP